MASIINASTSGAGGLISTADASGQLDLQSGGVTAVSIIPSQGVAFTAGSASLPAITTSGDANTGVFFPAADTIAFSEGGTEALRLTSTGAVSFGSSGTAYGTAGQVLTSAGNAPPAWTSQAAPSFFTSGSGIYTVPAGCTLLKITVQGGGGNGGANSTLRATGGSAGGTAIKWLVVTPGGTLTYVVGGVATTSSVSGGSIFLTSVVGGGGTTGITSSYAASNTAGPSGGVSAGGDININGQPGGTSWGTSTVVGVNYSGMGGDSLFGMGGQMTMIQAGAGKNATGYGAGGGGALGNATAGAGTPGFVLFEPQ